MKICVFQNGRRRPFCLYHNKNTFWDFNFCQLLICCYYDPNLQENTTKQVIAIFLGSCCILALLIHPKSDWPNQNSSQQSSIEPCLALADNEQSLRKKKSNQIKTKSKRWWRKDSRMKRAFSESPRKTGWNPWQASRNHQSK